MKGRPFALVVTVVALGLAINLAGSLRAQQPTSIALTGQVSSAAEGLMEGVLVSARQIGSPMTVTVVSDAKGRYRFPVSHLGAGTYDLSIRAVGYDLASPSRVTVSAGATTNADVRLKATDHLEDQMSDGEWIESAPGTEDQKRAMLDCSGCHSLQRIVDSYHTEADFKNIILPRMGNYSFQTFWLKPQPFKVPRNRTFFSSTLPAFLAHIDQSTGPRAWPLRTYPRPTGAATRVIITRYDLPSELIQPHDVTGTPDGTIWFGDFGEQILGRLNPKTGAVKLYTVPTNKPEDFTGSLDTEADPSGNLWLANMTQGQIVRFEPKTETFTQFRVPPGPSPEFTQESMVSPTYMNVNGIVWTNNQDNHSFDALDPATGTWKVYGPFYYPGSTTHSFNAYGMPTDPANGIWGLDFGGEAIAHFDPKTGKMTIMPTPTKDSHPRRGHVDPRTWDLWFAEFYQDRIGTINTKDPNAKITEYVTPTKWDSPYDVIQDKNGDVWAGSMLTDRITRLNPTTGKAIDYLMPSSTNTRRMWIDNSTSPVTVWTGANHEHAIMKIETF